MTKFQKGLLDNYNRAWERELSDCYHNASEHKRRAFFDCKYRRIQMEGYDMRIPTHNAQMFSCAWKVNVNGHVWLHYETHMNTYFFDTGEVVMED